MSGQDELYSHLVICFGSLIGNDTAKYYLDAFTRFVRSEIKWIGKGAEDLKNKIRLQFVVLEEKSFVWGVCFAFPAISNVDGVNAKQKQLGLNIQIEKSKVTVVDQRGEHKKFTVQAEGRLVVPEKPFMPSPDLVVLYFDNGETLRIGMKVENGLVVPVVFDD